MGIHSFPALALHAEDMTEVRRDMWIWAEPVITDCAAECYEGLLPNRLASNIMARKHAKLWQAVIHDQPEALPQLREDLKRTAEKFGLDATAAQEVDTALFDELVDIVWSRFRASRRTTRIFSAVLVSATSCFNPSRAVA